MIYSLEQVAELRQAVDALPVKYQALMFAYYGRNYRSARGKEFAMQGFMRRLGTLVRCIDQVFAALPPELEGIPEEDEVKDAAIALQAFIFNVFGCADNLAWVWVEEKAIRRRGSPLPWNAIGLGRKYSFVWKSFSSEFRRYLKSRKKWFAHLQDYRHALAHRIPLYIPPHCVSPADQDTYNSLEQQISAAVIAGDTDEEAPLRAAQRALMFFRPLMMHSYVERADPVYVHHQMLADFHTIEEMAQRMLKELELERPALRGGLISRVFRVLKSIRFHRRRPFK